MAPRSRIAKASIPSHQQICANSHFFKIGVELQMFVPQVFPNKKFRGGNPDGRRNGSPRGEGGGVLVGEGVFIGEGEGVLVGEGGRW